MKILNFKFKILLWAFILAYILYFSWLTILRYQTLYASYFDLGIMHQTVFNTYRAITNLDPTRVLELTNPFGQDQIKRMAIHNDVFLALLSPFYFIYASPATLLVLQTIVLALGALAIFKITQIVFEKSKYKDLFSLIFSISYLLYPFMERANLFDFHAVTFSTTLLLFMFYFWLKGSYRWSFIFFVLSLLTKEQLALTTLFFGVYTLYQHKKEKKPLAFPLSLIGVSLLWFILSIKLIIPYFRGSEHFALSYFGEFGETPGEVVIGVLSKPYSLSLYLFRGQTYQYLLSVLGPLGFLSAVSPLELLIALPEFAINLLSSNNNQRLLIYHYEAILTPFVFISAIYGARKVKAHLSLGGYIILFSFLFAALKSPLPFSSQKEVHPILYPQKETQVVKHWANILKNEDLHISTTGQLAPFFTSRRYFYTFSKFYKNADYVVLRLNEIYNYPEKDKLIPVYEELQEDKNYQLIYKKKNFEVYKRFK